MALGRQIRLLTVIAILHESYLIYLHKFKTYTAVADALLSVENLTKTYGDKVLFENITFGVNVGQKTALIARNGYGKSTLLNILTGTVLPDDGKVTYSSASRMVYLPQNPIVDQRLSVLDYMLAARRHDDEEPWAFEQRVEEVLSRMKVDTPNKRLGDLSGGERKRVALSRILVDDANFVILDEPTNHLDIEMIEWLEEFLNRQRLSLLLVSHDRYFIDNVCDDIIEIDNGRLYHYEGDFAYYIEKKAERECVERAEVAKARSLYRTELEWMRRMPQARGTKARARIDAFYQLEEKAKTRFDDRRPQLTVKTERIGGKILELYNINFQREGRPIISDFSYCFKRGEKIGIVGPNGIGKSTLLNIMTESLRPDSGRVVVGQTIQFGYYTQEGLREKEDKRVIDIVKDVAEQIDLDGGKRMSAHQFLSYFGFDDTTQYNYYGNLSGGERRRLYLLKVLMANPNFLILDEPTNDLDIYTLQILEQFLRDYRGCLLIVSHDRSFMDHIVDHLFVFEHGGLIRDYHSNYTDYRAMREQQRRNEVREQQIAKPRYERPKPAKVKATYKEQKEWEQLGEEITQLTAEKQRLEAILASGAGDEVVAASVTIGEVMAALDEKELRWLELDEKVNP